MNTTQRAEIRRNGIIREVMSAFSAPGRAFSGPHFMQNTPPPYSPGVALGAKPRCKNAAGSIQPGIVV